jgi:hypothetical protein
MLGGGKKFFSLWHGVEMSLSDMEVLDEVGISFAAFQPSSSFGFIYCSSLGKVPELQIEAITQTDLKMKIHLKVCLILGCILFLGLQEFIPSAPKFLHSVTRSNIQNMKKLCARGTICWSFILVVTMGHAI